MKPEVRSRRYHRGTSGCCRLLAAWSLAVAPALLAQEPESQRPIGRLRDVRVETRDVFSDAEAEANWFYALANALHGVSYEEVAAREVWFQRGETLTMDHVEELERKLRALGLFGAVTVEPQEVADGEVDLLLRTRDRFTLGGSASYSSIGGSGKFDVRLSESNLFGTGKRLSLSSSTSDDERKDAFEYFDQQLFGSRHLLLARIGETDEGRFADFNLRRPFHHLADPLSYGLDATGADEVVDYYRDGETFAEVPQRRRFARLFATAAAGPRHLRRYAGVDLGVRRRDYEPATGVGAATVRVPGDTDEIEAGASYAIQQLERYEQAAFIDRLGYVEDLWLGVSARLHAAGRYRDEERLGPELQPVLGFESQLACKPFDDTWLTLAADGAMRWNQDRMQGWDTSVALHAFQRSLPSQTLAGSFTFDYAGDRQDLAPQFTLGEDNGLRGYPAREFAGSRIARLNLEDRIDTGIELWTVHVGAVAFFDVGWVHDLATGQSLGDALRSAGAGLRFGSTNLFGNRVLRLDFAWPLDDVGGEDFGLSISFGSGQVFNYFGNANELGSAF